MYQTISESAHRHGHDDHKAQHYKEDAARVIQTKMVTTHPTSLFQREEWISDMMGTIFLINFLHCMLLVHFFSSIHIFIPSRFIAKNVSGRIQFNTS